MTLLRSDVPIVRSHKDHCVKLSRLTGFAALAVIVVALACTSPPSPQALALEERARTSMKDLLQERLVDVKVVEQKDDLTVKVDFFARPPYDPGSESLLIDYGIRELVKLRIEADMMSAYEVLFQSNLQFHEVSMAARLYTSRNPQGRLEEEIVYRTSMSSATLDSIRWDEIDLGKPERRPPWDVEYVSSTLSERGSSTLAFP